MKQSKKQPPEGALPPVMEEYLHRACQAADERIDRLFESSVVTPDPGYLDKLCESARKHKVALRLNVRTGQVEVHGYPDFVGGGLVAGLPPE